MDNSNQQNVQGNDAIPSLDNVLDSVQGVGEGILDDLPTNPPANEPNEGAEANPPATPPSNEPAKESASADNSQDDFMQVLTSPIDSLTADNQNLVKEILTNFGATSVDANGNLLNQNGQVVLSYDNLNKYVETGELLLDDKGNQINELGEIVTPASDVVANSGMANILKDSIAEEYGFNFTDEKGNAKVYNNSQTGVKDLVDDVILNTRHTAVSSFLEEQPVLKNLFYHLQNGGTLDNFKETAVDYSAIDLQTLSKEQKFAYIKEAYDRQGFRNAANVLKLLESASDESINQNAADALLTLRDLTEEQRAKEEKAYQDKLEADKKEVVKYWEGVNSVIKNGKLKDLQIPESEKADFFKYIAEPINANGDTRESLAFQKEDQEFSLLVSYLRYKDYDFSKLIKDRAGLSKLEQLRQRIQQPNPKIVSDKPITSGEGGRANYVPSIENLLG